MTNKWKRFTLRQLLTAFVVVSVILAVGSSVSRLETYELLWLAALSPLALLQFGIGRTAAFVGMPLVGNMLCGASLWSALYLIFGLVTGCSWTVFSLLSTTTLGVIAGLGIGTFSKVRRQRAIENQFLRMTAKCGFVATCLIVVSTVAASLVALHLRAQWIAHQRFLAERLQTQGMTVEFVPMKRPWWLASTVADNSCFTLTVRFSPMLPKLLADGNAKELVIDRLEMEGPEVDDRVLSRVQHVTELRALSIVGSRATDSGLLFITHLDSLRYLDLSDTLVTDNGVHLIPHFANLETLLIARTQLTNRCMQELSRCNQMLYLDLSGTRIDGDGLKLICNMNKLKSLIFQHNSFGVTGPSGLRSATLSGLSLDDSEVSDRDLAQLGGLPALEHLFLRRTQVTATGLSPLASLPSLTGIWINNLAVEEKASVVNLRTKAVVRVQ